MREGFEGTDGMWESAGERGIQSRRMQRKTLDGEVDLFCTNDYNSQRPLNHHFRPLTYLSTYF